MASSRKKPAPRRKSPPAPLPLAGKRVLPLSEVRSRLSPLVRTLSKQQGAVGIAVRGKVQAYLVAAEQYDQEQRKARVQAFPLEGSLKKFFKEPEDIEKAIKQGREEMIAGVLQEWDEMNRE
jgi:PHD/YefM family antitoxin component YafN of YafNO toxin-antitoxin module